MLSRVFERVEPIFQKKRLASLLNHSVPGLMHHIEQWFRQYYPILTAYAHKMLKDQEAARDLVQDLFIHLHEKGKRAEELKSPKSYLFQAVHNRCLNYLQKQSRFIQQPLEEAKPLSAELNDQLEQVELEHHLFQWIEKLPPACKQVFKMSRFLGKKNQEIAEELGISKRTVETQISKALKTLRSKLQESPFAPKTKSRLWMFLFLHMA